MAPSYFDRLKFMRAETRLDVPPQGYQWSMTGALQVRPAPSNPVEHGSFTSPAPAVFFHTLRNSSSDNRNFSPMLAASRATSEVERLHPLTTCALPLSMCHKNLGNRLSWR